ncbi:uncharacterized protein LOC117182980 [Belonocnema kinseyi]|uniref:uncharacterized protein LOC117182980 n=1 Tax=Belonocnema kinseyi TaxID=2817044 RepID=UPI00143D5D30|nr:uncharacterized protein LOC117182980 [Belonocnema kinseyi]
MVSPRSRLDELNRSRLIGRDSSSDSIWLLAEQDPQRIWTIGKQIVILSETGHSRRKIAQILEVSQKGVRTTFERFVGNKSFSDRKRSGRPRKTTKSDDRLIKVLSKRSRLKTVPDIRAEINQTLPKPVTRQLHDVGLYGRVAAKKPLLRSFRSGSVMVCGCFCYAGVGTLVKIDLKMRKEDYHRILQRSAIPSGIDIIGEDSKDAARTLKFMEWPPQSPDANPIELLWDELDREVQKLHPTSESHLWQCLQQAWQRLRPERLQKLVERIPRI